MDLLQEVSVNGAKVDATKFEIDLVEALNGNKETRAYQNPVAQQIAQRVASGLRGVGVQGTAKRNSGRQGGTGPDKANSASALTQIYRDYGVTNGEPKTDIVVGKYRFSMKYARQAQIAAAQSSEAQAVFAAAFQGDTVGQQLVETHILPLLKTLLDKRNFYRIRKRFNAKDLAAFGNALSRLLALHSTQGGFETEADRRSFRDFLGLVGLDAPIRGRLYTFLEAPATKETLFYEFASGDRRFIDRTNTPTHMLSWYEDGNVRVATVRAFIKTHLSHFDYSFRDRGSARGGSFRLGIFEATEPLSCATAVATCTAYAHAQHAALLREGVFDTLASAAEALWDRLVALVLRFVRALVALASQGVERVLALVGVEPATMAFTWPAE